MKGVEPGVKIRIVSMDGEPRYTGKVGTVERVFRDPWGDWWATGTWGGCNLLLTGEDAWEIIND